MRLKQSKYPIQITYDLTDYCNAKCIHCYSNSSSKRYTEFENEKEVVERVIEELVKVKPLTLIVSGGEPLLSPHFEYFIKSTLL